MKRLLVLFDVSNDSRNSIKDKCFSGIYVHSSSELKYNYNIHRPIVRCSVVDAATGQLLRGSRTNNEVNRNKNIEIRDVIQPVVTKGCRFISSK